MLLLFLLLLSPQIEAIKVIKITTFVLAFSVLLYSFVFRLYCLASPSVAVASRYVSCIYFIARVLQYFLAHPKSLFLLSASCCFVCAIFLKFHFLTFADGFSESLFRVFETVNHIREGHHTLCHMCQFVVVVIVISLIVVHFAFGGRVSCYCCCCCLLLLLLLRFSNCLSGSEA